MALTRETYVAPTAITRESELTPVTPTRETELTPEKYTKEWMKNFGYEVGDKVKHNNAYFTCSTAHHSLDSNEAGIGANWADYWDASAKDWTNEEPWEDRDNSWQDA